MAAFLAILSRLHWKANGKYQRETPSFPSLDGCRLDQSPPPPLGLVAHMKRIPICEVFGDVPVIGERYVRTFFCQTHPISIVFEFMRKKSNSRFLPTTHDGKQHLDSSRRRTLTMPTMTSRVASNKRVTCGMLRIKQFRLDRCCAESAEIAVAVTNGWSNSFGRYGKDVAA